MKESKDALSATQARVEEAPQGLESQSGSFFDPKLSYQVIIYMKTLFGLQIPYKEDAHEPESSSSSMLNNYTYNLQLARSTFLSPTSSMS